MSWVIWWPKYWSFSFSISPSNEYSGLISYRIDGFDLQELKRCSGVFQHKSSVQFSCSVVSNSLQPHELQHARPPCPLPTPGVYSNSCPLSRWCHLTISSSVVPFSSCPQSFPASGSFQMSQLFPSGGQSIGVSASASVLPMNIQDWSSGWTGWISLQSKGLSSVFSNATVQNYQFFGAQLSSPSESHIHSWLLEKSVLIKQTFVGKVMSLLFNMLSRLVIIFLPRSQHLLIWWLQSPSAVILEPKEIKSLIKCFHCFPVYFPQNEGTRCHNLSFLNVEL